MTKALLTAARMRALEAGAFESGRVSGRDLMERAGRGVVAALEAEWPGLAAAPGRARVLCGPGNNGGDGFVVARLLAERGWDVAVFLLGEVERLPPDARANHDRWAAIGSVAPLSTAAGRALDGADLVVDALFGIGLSRPLEGIGGVLRDLRACVAAGQGRALAERRGRWPVVVAVDVPSGLCADSGRSLGPDAAEAEVCAADLTVTFQTRKPGHLLQDGPQACGRVVVVDLGLRPSTGDLWQIDGPAAALDKQSGHKFDHGHALVLTGGMGRTGAARLAARAALRVGAGLVTVGAPGSAMMECAAQLTAVMLRRCEDGPGLATLLEDGRINALCLGPGLGLDARAGDLVAQAMSSGRALVVDADALTLIAADAALMTLLHSGCVLTPHGGEFARLFPDIAERLSAAATSGPAFSKVDATRAAAERAGCTVLFKGADTLIADPQGRTGIHAASGARAAPWLATAGAGDVLAGLIAGLMARGMAPMAAAETATWAHVQAALDFGPGLIAEDLPEGIPAVLRGTLSGGREKIRPR